MKTIDVIIVSIFGAAIGFSITGIEGSIMGFIAGFIIGDRLK